MWTISNNKDWSELQKQFDWVRDMDGVPQDPVYHAEGDVAIHTRMVLEALEGLPEYQALLPQEQEIIWAAALMHDMEKRSTTVIEDDGRITSARHAKKGAQSARQVLYRDVLTPYNIREAVVKLVRHHGLPLWLLQKPNPEKSAVMASMEVRMDWVAILAKADVLGRTSNDCDELLLRVALFRETCLELNCWEQPRQFATEAAKMDYLNKDAGYIDYVPYENPQFTVVLMAGLPGAGKDYHIQQHYKNWPIVSLDSIRDELDVKPTNKQGNGQVVQLAKERAKEHMRAKRDFVWNGTNITKSMREQLIGLFSTYGAKIRIDYIEVPLQKLLGQNQNREQVVPKVAMLRLIEKLDVPMPYEAHEVRYFINSK